MAKATWHLRPHKSVDRRIFMELLARYERWRPLANYAYVSMGGYSLEDHRMVHRRFAIARSISFDEEQASVARQVFNRPSGRCVCLTYKSRELIDELEHIVGEEGEEPRGVIVWLDYTKPNEIGEQIREFETLLEKLAEGDIVRVTVNAHVPALGGGGDGSVPAAELRRKRLVRLRERVGDYLPSDTKPEELDENGLPRLLGLAFGRAAMNAFPGGSETTFSLLSSTRYADGQQMMSITGVVVARADEDRMREALRIHGWPFFATTWGSANLLRVPDLTLRERMFLEQAMNDMSAEAVAERLGFDDFDGIKISDFLQDYQRYHRYYPSMLVAEV